MSDTQQRAEAYAKRKGYAFTNYNGHAEVIAAFKAGWTAASRIKKTKRKKNIRSDPYGRGW